MLSPQSQICGIPNRSGALLKRVLEVIAILLLVVGIELATGAVSYGLNQVLKVYFQLVAGTEPDVSLTRFFVGGGMVILGSGFLVLDLWARAYSGFLGRGKECPHCGVNAERVKRRLRHKILGWVLNERFTHRKCKRCGWRGLTGSP
jgi:hypothetical protein